MQIKRFKAPDMSTALGMVKKEFGPEAVILSVRDLEKGNGLFGMRDKGGIEVTAAMDAPLSEVKPPPAAPRQKPATSARPPVSISLSNARPKKRPTPSVRSVPRVPKSPEFYQRLIHQEVDEKIAREIVERIDGMPGEGRTPADRRTRGLCRILRERSIRRLDLEPESGRQRRIAFMGAPGVGKTTTIAKLTGFYSIRGRDVGIIALEDDRICAIRKAEIFAKIINVPIEVAVGRDGMRSVLRQFRSKEIVYVDTPGAGFKDAAGIRAIQSQLHEVPEIQNLLLVAAASREREIAELAHSFSPVPIHGLLVTKLDECVACGGLLNYLYQFPMALSFVADGQQIPEDIRPATPQWLAGLFTENDETSAAFDQPPAEPFPAFEDGPPEGNSASEIEEALEGFGIRAAAFRDSQASQTSVGPVKPSNRYSECNPR